MKTSASNIGFLTIFIILSDVNQSCILDTCDCLSKNFEYSIHCDSKYKNLSLSLKELNGFKIKLKLSANGLSLIEYFAILNALNLDSLDLTNNKNDFETYFESINRRRNSTLGYPNLP